MDKFLIFVLAAAFFAMASGHGVPVWESEDSDDVIPSSLQIGSRRCSCENHHHECGCCLQIKAHIFHKKIDANVCMNATYVPSPLAVEVFMTWDKHVLFNKTISAADPPPICFGIPHLDAGKACVKFSKVSLEKHHIGACAALEFKAHHFGKDIPLGCFYFRGANDGGFDVETFLDTESLKLVLEDLFRSSTSGLIETTYFPNNDISKDDVTDLVTVDGGDCDCGKSPPHCDCCVQFKLIVPIKACVHADVDQADTGFNVAVTIDGLTIFKKHISVANPPPICHDFKIGLFKGNICLKLTNVSLAPGHTGACLEVDIKSQKRALGCFYMSRQVTKE